ncbi:hypothetical protein TTRE_0000854701 [Trichuris trichiura]|uniref:Uncharacterized protein n=1 Tax=Trichuris trichiura TaxID=36087 RepID=A0A077ZIH9_TRITR|nr:hypothetical protein TTRE_0000854701 [Trichuris trichiura]
MGQNPLAMLTAQCNRLAAPKTTSIPSFAATSPMGNCSLAKSSSFQPWKKCSPMPTGTDQGLPTCVSGATTVLPATIAGGAQSVSAPFAGADLSTMFQTVTASGLQGTPAAALTPSIYNPYPAGGWLQASSAHTVGPGANSWWELHGGTSPWLDSSSPIRAAAQFHHHYPHHHGNVMEYGSAAAAVASNLNSNFAQANFSLIPSGQVINPSKALPSVKR